MIKAAIMGFGTVGSGIYEIIKNHDFEKKIGEEIEISKILDIRDFEDNEFSKIVTKDFEDILNDNSIKVAAEAMGGLHPAYEFTKKLLQAGKSVVTSNKELVATYGTELLEIAKENNVCYLFEASVGGGIPIIRPLTSCLLSNDILRIAGILNGTTNYILTQMFENGKSFEVALSDAQKLGYAERNPAADVEGHDACRKIAILSSLAWGEFVDYNDIYTEGITNITLADVSCAEKYNSVIKLIGYAENKNGAVSAMVRPMLVKKGSPLAGVNDVFNAILVTGDSLGDAMFYGKGAGKLATASAVVADIIDCVKHNDEKKHTINWKGTTGRKIEAYDECEACFMVRIKASEDEKKLLDDIAENILEEGKEICFVSVKIKEKLLKEKLGKISGEKTIIRILED